MVCQVIKLLKILNKVIQYFNYKYTIIVIFICLFFYTFLFFLLYNLNGGNNGITSLDEVMLHVALEVEVGELIILGDLEELGELLIRVDAATILLILKTISLDVCVDLLAHVRASHLSANGLAEELSELVTDAGGLHEARGLTVASVAALLGGRLLGGLDLTGDNLLKGLEIILDGGEETNKLLELGVELGELKGDGRGGVNRGRSSGISGRKLVGDGLRNRSGGGSLDLLGLGCGCRSSGGNNGCRRNGGRGGLIRGL